MIVPSVAHYELEKCVIPEIPNFFSSQFYETCCFGKGYGLESKYKNLNKLF